MNGDDEYRRQAEEAEKQARAAKNDHDRESWLKIAQDWRGLLWKRPQSDDDSGYGTS
jgi:hypothetical protein